MKRRFEINSPSFEIKLQIPAEAKIFCHAYARVIYGVVASVRDKLSERTLGKGSDCNVSWFVTSQRFWNFGCSAKMESPYPAMFPSPFLSPARFLKRHLVSLTFVPRVVFWPFNSVPPIVNRVPALTERRTRAPVPLNLHAVFMNSSSAFRRSLIILNSEFEMYEMDEWEIMCRVKEKRNKILKPRSL